MSVRECIEVGYPVDVDAYLGVLQAEFGAWANPTEAESFLIDDPPLPFYRPQSFEGRTYISSFNKTPLSELLVLALIEHPKLAPRTTTVRWTIEQERLVDATLLELKARYDGETIEGPGGPERRA